MKELIVQTPVKAVALVVLVLGAAQLLLGPLTVGVTTDEPIHVERAMGWVEEGWYVPDSLLAGGEPDPASSFSSPYVYGPAYALLAHAANAVVGNEALDGISFSAGAYQVRHLVVALLAALAIAAVGVAVASLTRSRPFGAWAAAGLLAIPAWTGYAFFNPKDVPAAAGYTLVTVALLLALREGLDGSGTSPRRRFAIGATLAVGIFVAVGTRTALWLPLAASIGIYALLVFGRRRLGGITPPGETGWAVAMGALAGFAAVAVAYPKAARSPFTLLTDSVAGASDFPYEGFTLTAGQFLSEQPPWWYLPTWIWASMPLLLGGLALLGGVLAVRALVRSRGPGWRGEIWSRPELGVVLVLQQALFLPLAAMVNGSAMYNGMRQHLYVLPALAILAGLGAQRLWVWAKLKEPVRRNRALAATVLCAALAVPTAEQLLLFPYNYAYVNPAAGIGGVNDNWETDYWFASGPEALSRVPAGAPLRCSTFLVLPWDAGGDPETYRCEEDEQTEPFLDLVGTDVSGDTPLDASAVWLIARKRVANQPPEYCEPVDDVTRWLRGEQVVMAHVLRCDPEALPAR